jgi:DNA-binding transcriptional LysR family regulator
MPKAHRLANRTSIQPVDLEGEQLLALSPDDTVRRAMDRAFAEHNVKTQIAVETPYGLTIGILASLGVGIGLINPLVLAGQMITGVVVKPFEPAIHFRALLLRPPDGINSVIVDDFIKLLYQTRNSLELNGDKCDQ